MSSDFTKMFLNQRHQEILEREETDLRERKRLEPHAIEFESILKSIEVRINDLITASVEARRCFETRRVLGIASGKSPATTLSRTDIVSISTKIVTKPEIETISVYDSVHSASISFDVGNERGTSHVMANGSLFTFDLGDHQLQDGGLRRSQLTSAQINCVEDARKFSDDGYLSNAIAILMRDDKRRT